MESRRQASPLERVRDRAAGVARLLPGKFRLCKLLRQLLDPEDLRGSEWATLVLGVAAEQPGS